MRKPRPRGVKITELGFKTGSIFKRDFRAPVQALFTTVLFLQRRSLEVLDGLSALLSPPLLKGLLVGADVVTDCASVALCIVSSVR